MEKKVKQNSKRNKSISLNTVSIINIKSVLLEIYKLI